MNRKKYYDLLALALLATAFVYTLLRALLISVFHDEAVTFLYLAALPYDYIMDYSRQGFAPNNHLLNTLLIKAFTQVLGISEIVIRLPALLGHLLYLMAVYKICRMVAEREVMVGGVALLIFNPFVLELFSAARGYALGLGFFMTALYFFMRRIQTKDPVEIRRCYLFASVLLAFAIMSNFIFLQVYISFFILALVYEMVVSPGAVGNVLRRLSIFIYSILVIIIFCWSPMMVIRERIAHEPYLGGESGFWRDTVMSLIQDSLYGQYHDPQNIQTAIGVLIGIVFFASAGIIFKVVNVQRGNDLKRLLIGAWSWLAATVGFMCFQWRVLGIKYVIGRHAVFFVPIFMVIVLILWSLSKNAARPNRRRVMQAAFWLITVLLIGHFLRSANFKQYYICPYAASAKAMMEDVARLNQGRSPDQPKIKIATHWMFSPMVDFYYLRYHLYWLEPLAYWTNISPNADYYYTFDLNSSWAKTEDEVLKPDFDQLRVLHLKQIKKYDLTETQLTVKQ